MSWERDLDDVRDHIIDLEAENENLKEKIAELEAELNK